VICVADKWQNSILIQWEHRIKYVDFLFDEEVAAYLMKRRLTLQYVESKGKNIGTVNFIEYCLEERSQFLIISYNDYENCYRA
jgi:hypothetical protein